MQPEQVARGACSRSGLALNLLVLCCAFGCNEASKPMGLECEQGAVCKDSDCDTICDDAEDAKHKRDTDRDGTPDFEDLDSDADGIPDLEEAGDDDPLTPPFDRNLDEIADYLDKHYPLDAGKDRPLPSSGTIAMGVSADTHLPDAQLYVPYVLDGAKLYDGDDAQSYAWKIDGSACDELFAALDPEATPESGMLSVTLSDADQAEAHALFTSPGDYEVTLRVATPSGDQTRSFELRVRARGIRVELCWDKTGPHAGADAVDLDLHLAKRGATEAFFTPEDCYGATCLGAETPWDYASTAPSDLCSGAGAQNDALYLSLGSCPNPRLDRDNRLDQLSATSYRSEAIALDNPDDTDSFRVMVHYVANASTEHDVDVAESRAMRETHPIVNVYCDGELRATFGGIPGVLGDSEEVGLSYAGQMWRVADIVSAAGTCDVKPLASPEDGENYWVSGFDANYGD